jgi:hypothetical protein
LQVVTAPLIGKVSEVSTYRIIGTVSGGELEKITMLNLKYLETCLVIEGATGSI